MEAWSLKGISALASSLGKPSIMDEVTTRMCLTGEGRIKKENLCLYGFPSEQWEVNLSAEEVPPELPEPALGINFARDGMQEKDWLSLVAVHNDAWLLSVSFYFGARFGFGKSDRKRLFNMINDLPTVFEVVNGTAQTSQKEKSTVSNHSSTKSKSNSKPPPPSPTEEEEEGLDDEEKEDDDEHGETLCNEVGEGPRMNIKLYFVLIHVYDAKVYCWSMGLNALNLFFLSGPPPKLWERAGSSSGPAPFKPASAGSISDVVESSGTARPDETFPQIIQL
ncbi:PHD finger protein ALFIN-LIKE 4-like protein [Tanacetum coccineum]